MKLWQTGTTSVDEAIIAFAVGDDPVLDRALVPFDCLASCAHAIMLHEIGVLSAEELDALRGALREAYSLASAGRFEISVEQEDGHSALEQLLVAKAGEAGLKIHTGRSRNDQVIAAVRLYARDRLMSLSQSTLTLCDALLNLADTHRQTPMPGYTHTRQAMPSTVGTFFGAAGEGLLHDVETMLFAFDAANRSALGSASGYGVPLPLERARVAELLGCDGMDSNTLHVQNTRGRLESVALFALHQLALTLGRLATDLIWFSSEAFGYFSLPDALTTGSSIMPQKRNPDVFELCRGAVSSFLARYVEVTSLLHGLPAGYHRDLQRTKQPLLAGLREADALVSIMTHATLHVQVNEAACAAALRPEIFATDHAYAEVRQGASFRAAYRAVKHQAPQAIAPEAWLAARTHAGAPGVPDHAVRDTHGALSARVAAYQQRLQQVAAVLVGEAHSA